MDCADTTADRFPIVRGILVPRGILAGGAHVTVVGERFDEYPVLGARFISDTLPELYAYAVPALRFTLPLVLSICVVGPRMAMTHQKSSVGMLATQQCIYPRRAPPARPPLAYTAYPARGCSVTPSKLF